MDSNSRKQPRYRCPLCEERYVTKPKDESCAWHAVKLVPIRISRGYLMIRRKEKLC